MANGPHMARRWMCIHSMEHSRHVPNVVNRSGDMSSHIHTCLRTHLYTREFHAGMNGSAADGHASLQAQAAQSPCTPRNVKQCTAEPCSCSPRLPCTRVSMHLSTHTPVHTQFVARIFGISTHVATVLVPTSGNQVCSSVRNPPIADSTFCATACRS